MTSLLFLYIFTIFNFLLNYSLLGKLKKDTFSFPYKSLIHPDNMFFYCERRNLVATKINTKFKNDHFTTFTLFYYFELFAKLYFTE